MTFETKVALRFLKEGKGQSIFILLGISIGVSVLIFLNTLITGLQENLIDQTIGSSAHIWLTAEQEVDIRPAQLSDWESVIQVLENRSDVNAVSPLVDGNAFYLDGQDASTVIIKGFIPEKADPIYGIRDKVVDGSYAYSSNYVLVGTDFFREHELSLGSSIRVTLPSGGSRTLIVNGVFDLGNGQANGSWIIMDFSAAQKLLGFGNRIARIELQVEDVFAADATAASIGSTLSDIQVDNWIEENSSLLTALSSQSASSIMIQVFVLLAITLGIASVLAVTVVQKSKQLGILKAMGTNNSQASRIFLLQGAMLGLAGAGAGIAIGIALVKMFLWGTSISTGQPLFPLTINWLSIGVIAAISFTASTVAAFIPAKRSSRLNPVEVIRNG